MSRYSTAAPLRFQWSSRYLRTGPRRRCRSRAAASPTPGPEAEVVELLQLGLERGLALLGAVVAVHEHRPRVADRGPQVHRLGRGQPPRPRGCPGAPAPTARA